MLVSSVVNNNQISGAGRFKVGAGAVSFLVLSALCHLRSSATEEEFVL